MLKKFLSKVWILASGSGSPRGSARLPTGAASGDDLIEMARRRRRASAFGVTDTPEARETQQSRARPARPPSRVDVTSEALAHRPAAGGVRQGERLPAETAVPGALVTISTRDLAHEIDPSVLGFFSSHYAHERQMLPFRFDEGILWIATARPIGRRLEEEVRWLLGSANMGVRGSRYVIADDAALLARLVAINYPRRDAHAGAALTSVSELATLFRARTDGPTDVVLDGAGDGHGMRGLVNHLLCEAVESGASDLHIDTSETDLVLRLTIDGVSTPSTLVGLPAFFGPQVISVIKQNARRDIVDTKSPKSGEFTAKVDNRGEPRRMKFRVETTPTNFGEACTVRIFSAETQSITLEEICHDRRTLAVLLQVARQRHGLLVLSGPTGSGKNTTMYAVIEKVDRTAERVIAIENPIEIVMDGVRAIPVDEEAGLTFPKALKSALRQAPRRLIIGEIRCRETADLAIRAAQTGHQVLTTVHASDAPTTIPRLLKEGIEPHMLATALDVVVAQRLLGRVCSVCAEPVSYPDFVLLNEQFTPSEVRALRERERTGHVFRRGRGCTVCRQTGLDGRVAIHETMVATDAIRASIEANEAGMEREIRRLAFADGMRSLRRVALELAACGTVSFDEAVALTKRVPEADFRWMCGDDYVPPGDRRRARSGDPVPPRVLAGDPPRGQDRAFDDESIRRSDTDRGAASLRDRIAHLSSAGAVDPAMPLTGDRRAGGNGHRREGEAVPTEAAHAGLLPGLVPPLDDEIPAIESVLDTLCDPSVESALSASNAAGTARGAAPQVAEQKQVEPECELPPRGDRRKS